MSGYTNDIYTETTQLINEVEIQITNLCAHYVNWHTIYIVYDNMKMYADTMPLWRKATNTTTLWVYKYI